ncbi:MAG: beta-ketoacyl-[acyl-carrier-protein] synthase II, partial [Candidatus Omnitrophica bacterium]|nr:beta-ketoacyl-[acyl-carrier-protein] synthase II [Candidatus Omnitrophota bacterium]
MSEKRRVVVTGLGVLASNGIGKDAFWEAIKSGRSGVATITSFDASSFATHFAGEIKNFTPETYVLKKNLRRMDRTSQLAVAAAKMAVQDANLDPRSNGRERTGVMIGTAMAGHGYIMKHYEEFLKTGPSRVSPFIALASFPDA